MAQKKRLRTLTNKFKDIASHLKASLSIRTQISTVQINILRATTHNLSSPPSESTISAVLSTAGNSHSLPRTIINTLMDRLHTTKNATVAIKCLFTLHNIVSKGSFTLKDQLCFYPSYGGHNFLNLSTFRDDSDFDSLQLSSWVRWYAGVLEQILTVSRILGYYLKPNSIKIENLNLGLSNADLLYKLEGLVGFVEQISFVPESLDLQRNELVYEIVRMVGEDYRNVQGEILLRLKEFGKRIEKIEDEKFDMDVGELNELVSYLKRLEESKEKLVMLFVNRKMNNGFWELVREIKMKGLEKKKEIEGKWVTVVVNCNSVADELTQLSTNPFLEQGQYLSVSEMNFATIK